MLIFIYIYLFFHLLIFYFSFKDFKSEIPTAELGEDSLDIIDENQAESSRSSTLANEWILETWGRFIFWNYDFYIVVVVVNLHFFSFVNLIGFRHFDTSLKAGTWRFKARILIFNVSSDCWRFSKNILSDCWRFSKNVLSDCWRFKTIFIMWTLFLRICFY